MARQKANGKSRIGSRQHSGIAPDTEQPKHRNRHKPGQHHGTKCLCDIPGAQALHRKKHKQDDRGHRHHMWDEGVGRDIEPFQRAEHRDRRRDDPVAVDERGAEQPACNQRPFAAAPLRSAKRHQSEDATLTVIVGAHDEHAVLDRDRDDERPEDQRQAAECAGAIEYPTHRLRDGFERVQRAGAQISIDDAERSQDCGRGHSPFPRARQSIFAIFALGRRHCALRTVRSGESPS
jgi:hypothetical protein